MSDDLDLPTGDTLEEETETEPEFNATRTMAPAHDQEPLDEDDLAEDDLDGNHGHSSISLLGTEEEDVEEKEIAKNYFLNGYDDEAPYSEFDEHGEPKDY